MRKDISLKVKLFKAGVSQRELARKTGIPESYISMAMQGKMNLDEEQKAKIAEVLEAESGK